MRLLKRSEMVTSLLLNYVPPPRKTHFKGFLIFVYCLWCRRVVIFRKAELMLFGLLSLLMGHWIVYVAKICIKTSKVSRRFYPCALESELNDEISRIDIADLNSTFMNYSVPRQLMNTAVHHYCPKVINFDLCGIELHMDAVADIQFLHRLY